MSLAPSRFRKWGRDADDFAAFPILAALSRRPLSTLELSRLLTTDQRNIRRNCKRLEELGWVVQRKDDVRWVMVVRLVAVGLPQPDGVPGVTPTAGKPIGAGPATSRIILEPRREAQEGPGGSAAVEPPPVAVAGQPGPARPSSELVAAHFSVPLELEGVGCRAGTLEGCKWCGARTPLKYGDPICPRCARKEATK